VFRRTGLRLRFLLLLRLLPRSLLRLLVFLPLAFPLSLLLLLLLLFSSSESGVFLSSSESLAAIAMPAGVAFQNGIREWLLAGNVKSVFLAPTIFF
jgi:hypothetical protein